MTNLPDNPFIARRTVRKTAKAVRPDGMPASPSSAARPLTSAALCELQEQATVVSALRRAGIKFAAVPNGHVRSKRQHIQAQSEGVQAGMPDLLIFDPPPARPDCFATALEMKREDARPSDLREDQLRWLTILGARGWAAVVGLGANDALTKLRQLGYSL